LLDKKLAAKKKEGKIQVIWETTKNKKIFNLRKLSRDSDLKFSFYQCFEVFFKKIMKTFLVRPKCEKQLKRIIKNFQNSKEPIFE